jgi:hypothetical protein
MAILTLEQYEAALKETVLLRYPQGTANNAAQYPWAGRTNPSAGNTANGLVPTAGVFGSPLISFSSGSGYITKIELSAGYAGRYLLYDRLFHAGEYAFNAAVTLTAQPSFASRIPGGANYTGLQLWIEGTGGSSAGQQSVAVTYTDQSGNAGHTTGVVSPMGAFAALLGTFARNAPMPLALGDSGISKIESVTGSVATGGTFNVYIARPLAYLRYPVANVPVTYPLEMLGMPQIWADSCLCWMTITDLSSSPIIAPEFAIEIASG